VKQSVQDQPATRQIESEHKIPTDLPNLISVANEELRNDHKSNFNRADGRNAVRLLVTAGCLDGLCTVFPKYFETEFSLYEMRKPGACAETCLDPLSHFYRLHSKCAPSSATKAPILLNKFRATWKFLFS
jgi:hypothetical protein